MQGNNVTIIARFIEMDSHLFLTLETLSAASCLASFSLSNLSFLVQARIALIKPGHNSETEKFFTDPPHCKSFFSKSSSFFNTYFAICFCTNQHFRDKPVKLIASPEKLFEHAVLLE